jgi:hypothetical protein
MLGKAVLNLRACFDGLLCSDTGGPFPSLWRAAGVLWPPGLCFAHARLAPGATAARRGGRQRNRSVAMARPCGELPGPSAPRLEVRPSGSQRMKGVILHETIACVNAELLSCPLSGLSRDSDDPRRPSRTGAPILTGFSVVSARSGTVVTKIAEEPLSGTISLELSGTHG